MTLGVPNGNYLKSHSQIYQTDNLHFCFQFSTDPLLVNLHLNTFKAIYSYLNTFKYICLHFLVNQVYYKFLAFVHIYFKDPKKKSLVG